MFDSFKVIIISDNRQVSKSQKDDRLFVQNVGQLSKHLKWPVLLTKKSLCCTIYALFEPVERYF